MTPCYNDRIRSLLTSLDLFGGTNVVDLMWFIKICLS